MYEQSCCYGELILEWAYPTRLEYLRAQINAEQISMDELIELQGLADHIQPGDVQLAEAAGIDEQEFAARS